MNPENRKEIPLWSSRAPLAIENDTDHLPTITPYYPSAWKFNCKAVVILPGGAYAQLADHEGRGYAEYLASVFGFKAIALVAASLVVPHYARTDDLASLVHEDGVVRGGGYGERKQAVEAVLHLPTAGFYCFYKGVYP